MKNKIVISTIFFFSLLSGTIAQTYHFEIKFSAKDTLAFDTISQIEYLSTRSINRKSNHQIPIDISDFPLKKAYIDSITQVGNILCYSKWLNTVVVGVSDSSVINSLRASTFISHIRYIGKNNLPLAKTQQQLETQIDYGLSEDGTKQMNGQYLHQQSYLGNGVLIAVLDAGYINVNTMNDFAHLFSNGKIIATQNFVLGNQNVYSMDNHGTNVLSILAAKNESNIYGTAVNASYLLLLTEDSRQENIIEEYYWLQAAEFADSCGADIISSSLGYNTFDSFELNYSYDDFGKNTSIVSQASNLASNKGILVIASAGNEGENSWKHIIFPADDQQCLTVGAVDNQGEHAGFSSTGTNLMSYYKPNVVALGKDVNVSSSNNTYTKANGTSFSCPLVSGLAACLWEALPDKKSSEIKNIIQESAHLYMNPNYNSGYGIPNFKLALQTHSATTIVQQSIKISPNPIKQGSSFRISSNNEQINRVQLVDLQGKSLQHYSPNSNSVTLATLTLKRACYFVIIEFNSRTEVQKLIVN